MVVALLLVAVILALIETMRERSLGWLAVAFIAAGLLWPQVVPA
jgi:hypothetical protein